MVGKEQVMIRKTTNKLICPFCKRDPCEGRMGDSEWGVEGGLEEWHCPCGAVLLVYYDVKFSHVEAEKEASNKPKQHTNNRKGKNNEK